MAHGARDNTSMTNHGMLNWGHELVIHEIDRSVHTLGFDKVRSAVLISENIGNYIFSKYKTNEWVTNVGKRDMENYETYLCNLVDGDWDSAHK